MRDGDVSGLAGLDRQRYSDDLSGHVIEAGCLGIDRNEIRVLNFLEPTFECLPVQDRFVVTHPYDSDHARAIREVQGFRRPQAA